MPLICNPSHLPNFVITLLGYLGLQVMCNTFLLYGVQLSTNISLFWEKCSISTLTGKSFIYDMAIICLSARSLTPISLIPGGDAFFDVGYSRVFEAGKHDDV